MNGPLKGRDVSGTAADPSGHTTVYWETPGKGGHYSYDVEDGQNQTERHVEDHNTEEITEYPDKRIVDDDYDDYDEE